MCLSPVTIYNPSRNYRDGLDKLYLSVPCGKCEACRRKKVNDWYVRLGYDYYNLLKHGGQVLFVTFTYNPESLPYLNTFDGAFDSLCPSYGEVPKVNIPCFSKKDVQYMLKRLRALLCENQLPPRYQLNITEGVKYFVVSEFGHEKKRPHYHVLFFLPKKVDTFVFQVLCELAWSRRIKSSEIPDVVSDYIESKGGVKFGQFYRGEHYFVLPPKKTKVKYQVFHRLGFVSYSYDKEKKISKPEVESVNCLRYVMKYLFKDVDFIENPSIKYLTEYMENFKPSITCDNKYMVRDIERLRDAYPFTLTSKFLGDSLFQFFDLSDKDANETDKILKTLVDGRVGLPESDGFLYAIPSYITRRLFYQNRQYGKYDYTVVTDLGLEVLRRRYDAQVEYLGKLYDMLISDAYIKILPEQFLDTFEKQFGKTLVYFVNEMSYFRNDVGWQRLAIYSLLYKNVVDIGYLTDCTPSNFVQKSRKLFVEKLAHRNLTLESLKTWLSTLAVQEPETLRSLDGRLYNYLPMFDGFDEILACFDFLKSAYSVVQFASKENTKKFKEAINNLYNSFIYV